MRARRRTGARRARAGCMEIEVRVVNSRQQRHVLTLHHMGMWSDRCGGIGAYRDEEGECVRGRLDFFWRLASEVGILLARNMAALRTHALVKGGFVTALERSGPFFPFRSLGTSHCISSHHIPLPYHIIFSTRFLSLPFLSFSLVCYRHGTRQKRYPSILFSWVNRNASVFVFRKPSTGGLGKADSASNVFVWLLLGI
jgi:hypothetical protein